ncbi:MAG: NAD(P)/FAD-dependent oxidoreductase [Candidatus Dormibacteria bacterium]
MAVAVDAVVVGAGPNGLAAAITLAEAGRQVVVLERSPTPGGGARSAELTLPGFVHDVCSAVHPLAAVSGFFRSLPLDRLGCELLQPAIPLAHPLDGGAAGALHRTVEDTAAGLGADAGQWRRLMGPLVRDGSDLLDGVLGLPGGVARHPLLLARFGVRALPPVTLLSRLFATPQARAMLAGMAGHAFLPLEAPTTSAVALVLAVAGQLAGWPVVRGGSGRLTGALVSHLEELGGEVRCEVDVRHLRDLPDARAVLFDTGPHQLAEIAGDQLPSGYLRALRRYRYGPGVFKVDYALSGPVPWSAAECRRAGTIHLGGTLEEVASSERSVAAGRVPERPYVLVAQPGVVDRDRAPQGGETLWTYCHVPNGATADMTEAIDRQIERFAPGFRDLILGRHVMGPADYERYNPNNFGGDIGGGATDWRQLVTRPVPRLASAYQTPNPRLLLCSASTPPGGGVHGLCGRNAARAALRGVLR